MDGEGTGKWRKLCNEEHHNLYFSSVVKIIELRRIRCQHVPHMHEMRNGSYFCLFSRKLGVVVMLIKHHWLFRS
jgi:hypothetical protein